MPGATERRGLSPAPSYRAGTDADGARTHLRTYAVMENMRRNRKFEEMVKAAIFELSKDDAERLYAILSGLWGCGREASRLPSEGRALLEREDFLLSLTFASHSRLLQIPGAKRYARTEVQP